jgi:4-hydroxythreonine-4-phosphate dehydrogenase
LKQLRKPRVGISTGDPSGIGPEILAAAFQNRTVRSALTPIVFGDRGSIEAFPIFRPFRFVSGSLQVEPKEPTYCAVSSLKPAERRPGRPSIAGGKAQLAYIRAAIDAAKRGWIEAICTGPVSKEQISRAGTPFMGHTELLASAFGCEVLMLMDGPKLRVALATNHLPLAKVPRALSTRKLVAQLKLLSRSLRPVLRRPPRIAVCGVNPHAGEGGLLGREEVTVIGPAIRRARAAGVRCEGPFAADGLFSLSREIPYDVVLAMFHDQGLVVTKALDFERTVNVTLGLPIPRTSPDHGVAYRLAGRGQASAEPMIHALLKAAELAVALG